MNSNLFESLKVIELASVLAGPSVGMFFAEHGAVVTKIENKKRGGDITRHWKLPTEDQSKPDSAYYSSVNYGKQVLMLDLTNEADQENLYDLVAEADIVISNFLPKVAEKLKVTYRHLKEINQRLLFGQILGYRSNPNAPAFDAVMQAELGFVSMNGSLDQQPAKMPVAMIDILAAHHLKEGILAALWKREKTNLGSHIEVALDEAAISSLVNQASNFLQVGHIPKRMGTMHPNIAPYGEIITTKDNAEIMLAIGTDQQYLALIEALNIGGQFLTFDSNQKRLLNRQVIFQRLQNEAIKYPKSSLIKLLDQWNIPFGIVRTLKEVFELKAYNNLILRDIDNKSLGVVRSSVFSINDAIIQ